ncbi:type II secretion system protein F [Pusillimonas caeni]|uniref:type II secretion system F family protein n=1 Tax=Pusillimonas caeni TaxID=1348472 RepID=UPI000E59B3C5|nr:type II secretion system F family protein [Pusillimonas caeni]TFL14081.1 type II secretion system protein F [Pusillimonas caeni]
MDSTIRLFKWRTKRSSFKRHHRMDFYRAMYLYHRAGARKLDALQKLYDTYQGYQSIWHRLGNRIYALLGGKSKPFQPVIAAVAQSGMQGRNLSLADALHEWLPPAERAILLAGETSGKPDEAFMMLGRFTRQQSGMWTKAMMASAYPVFMTFVVFGMLHFIGSSFLPGMDIWTLSQFSTRTQILVWLAMAVANYWYLGAAMLVIAVLTILYSLSQWKGTWRIKADRYPPWSLYRRIHGALFLYTFAVLQRSGVPIQTALSTLARNANPWLRTRISAAMLGIRQGYGLGRSLRNAGHNFPDWEALPVIESIDSLSGAPEALIEYSQNWLDDTATQIDKYAKRATGIGLIWVALWVLWLALSIIELIFNSIK